MSSQPTPSRVEEISISGLASFAPAISSIIIESEQLQQRWYEVTKRTLDVALSLFALLVSIPFLAVIGVVIKMTSPGPILFRHRRLGRDGQEFCCYKLRTMVADAEAQLRERADLRASFEVEFKLQADPRVTRLGAFLRQFSIDEVPQFWNVLKGEMTLIGPRPIILEEVTRYGRHAEKLLSVTPGLSGLWQTTGRSNSSYALRVELDMIYIDHRSFWLDLRLLARTFSTVLRRVGAH
jgi:lipopolysaccharide/colanic/teichoic acid biosynthesis glycosyltransferase